ncbi:MAG: O-antigen ligase family protein, partial [Desulfitobacteriaceae bacterium]|nr:O-antigen ligase family protein [Desulfitobacteriaceae bacterium]
DVVIMILKRDTAVYLSMILIVFSPFLALLPVVLLFFSYFRYHREGDFGYRGTWSLGLLLLFVWSLFVGIFNHHMMSVVASFAFLALYIISFFAQNRFQSEEDIEELFLYAFLLTIGSALFGVFENFNIINRDPIWWKYLFGLCTVIENEENLLRITGTFGNPNLAASWYAVMVLVGCYFAERKSGRKRVSIIIGTIFCVAVLIMTESRGALVGLFLGLFIYAFVFGQGKSRIMRFLLLLCGFVLALTYPTWFPRGDFLPSSIDLRQAIWENCFNLFLKKPVTGWGLMGIYFADSNVYQYLRILHAHNVILSLMTMLGSIGLAIFAWMEWRLLQDIIFLREKKCRLVPLLAGIHAIFIGHGLFDFTMMGQQIGILFIACSAIVGGLTRSFSGVFPKYRNILIEKNRLHHINKKISS